MGKLAPPNADLHFVRARLSSPVLDARRFLPGFETAGDAGRKDREAGMCVFERSGEAPHGVRVPRINVALPGPAKWRLRVLEPAARISQPPTLMDKTIAEDAITLTWQPPTSNIDGSTPVNVLGYNVYRMDESQSVPGQTPVNSTLISATSFEDKTFKFGSEYRYVVRAVSLGTEGAQVESLNSNILPVSPRDTFAPSPPSGLSVAGSPGRLSIFFAANSESDVAGYNIFRSTDPNLPKGNWTKLNPALLTRTSFVDDKVETGKRYYYYLIAVDTTGNISQPSDVVSEIVP